MNTLIIEWKSDLVSDASVGPAKTRFLTSERSAIITALSDFVLLCQRFLRAMAIKFANDRQATASFKSRKLDVAKSLNERLETYTQVLGGASACLPPRPGSIGASGRPMSRRWNYMSAIRAFRASAMRS